jgi:hypothetical protein
MRLNISEAEFYYFTVCAPAPSIWWRRRVFGGVISQSVTLECSVYVTMKKVNESANLGDRTRISNQPMTEFRRPLMSNLVYSRIQANNSSLT